jgi:hypothetical protein
MAYQLRLAAADQVAAAIIGCMAGSCVSQHWCKPHHNSMHRARCTHMQTNKQQQAMQCRHDTLNGIAGCPATCRMVQGPLPNSKQC